jgi:tRNA(fMet)-specific endonuclease VapC
MALFLLDTSVCVDILRDTLPAAELPAPGDCCLSAIVTAELRTGLAKRAGDVRRERKLDAFVALFPVRDFDDLAARHYADIRADLEGRGIPIGPLDLLIAAHARSLDAVVVTGNVAEFTRVRGLEVMSLSAGRKKR